MYSRPTKHVVWKWKVFKFTDSAFLFCCHSLPQRKEQQNVEQQQNTQSLEALNSAVQQNQWIGNSWKISTLPATKWETGRVALALFQPHLSRNYSQKISNRNKSFPLLRRETRVTPKRWRWRSNFSPRRYWSGFRLKRWNSFRLLRKKLKLDENFQNTCLINTEHRARLERSTTFLSELFD